MLIKKREDVAIKAVNDSKVFIEYSQCMDDVYNNIDFTTHQEKENI